MQYTKKPLHLRESNEFVEILHRHHKKVSTHKFSIGAYSGEELIGVVIVGRPVARNLEDGFTCEVNRLCVKDNQTNACSYLYATAARVAKEMGYKKIITYILENEPGVSLKASGWINEGVAGGGTWNRPNTGRFREDKHPLGPKQRYVKFL